MAKARYASLLAHGLDATYIEANSLHSHQNLATLARSEPLTNDDRWPCDQRRRHTLARGNTVVACSPLRRIYRDQVMAMDTRKSPEAIVYTFEH